MTDMTVMDVARACGVTERTVRRWLREGRLPAHRVGGRVRIPDRAVRELAMPYAGPSVDAPDAPCAGPSVDAPDAPDAADAPGWLASLHDPDRLAGVDVRRAARAIALMDRVRTMSVPQAALADVPGLVREGRDEQDARWDERLG